MNMDLTRCLLTVGVGAIGTHAVRTFVGRWRNPPRPAAIVPGLDRAINGQVQGTSTSPCTRTRWVQRTLLKGPGGAHPVILTERVSTRAPWRENASQERAELLRLCKLGKDERDLAATALMRRVHPLWAALVEHTSKYLAKEPRTAAFKAFMGDAYCNAPSAWQVLEYLRRNKIPHIVKWLDTGAVSFRYGGKHLPGVAVAIRAGVLCDALPYRCLRAVREQTRVVSETLPDKGHWDPFYTMDVGALASVFRHENRQLPFDVVHWPRKVRPSKEDREGRMVESMLTTAGRQAAALFRETMLNCAVSAIEARLLVSRARREQAALRRYAAILTKESAAFAARLDLLALEEQSRALIVGEAMDYPEGPRPAPRNYALAIGRSPPPVGEGGLGHAWRWYGYDTTEHCPGIVRSSDATLDLSDYLCAGFGFRSSAILRELTVESVIGERLGAGDCFYVRHAPAFSERSFCMGSENPATIRALRATLDTAGHEALLRLIPCGPPAKVRGVFYSIFTWEFEATTCVQDVVAGVLDPVVRAFVYTPRPLKWPRLGDIIGPNLDYKYRVLYTLYSQHVPEKCAGLLGLARSAEMGLEARSGVEPADVAASIVQAEEVLEQLSPGPAFQVS